MTAPFLPQVGGWWRSVRVQGKGRGAAVLQLTSKYHVSDASALLAAPTAAFHLRTRATWHGHNGSALTFTTCTRWLFQEASDASGVAVLEVTVPTGYGASASALQDYVASRAVPNLRRADFHQRKVTFYFEKVSPGPALLLLIPVLIDEGPSLCVLTNFALIPFAENVFDVPCFLFSSPHCLIHISE